MQAAASRPAPPRPRGGGVRTAGGLTGEPCSRLPQLLEHQGFARGDRLDGSVNASAAGMPGTEDAGGAAQAARALFRPADSGGPGRDSIEVLVEEPAPEATGANSQRLTSQKRPKYEKPLCRRVLDICCPDPGYDDDRVRSGTSRTEFERRCCRCCNDVPFWVTISFVQICFLASFVGMVYAYNALFGR